MSDDDEPLIGDELEEFLAKLNMDKLAKKYEEVSGKDCGCDKRKEWLNNFHKRIKNWFKRITQR